MKERGRGARRLRSESQDRLPADGKYRSHTSLLAIRDEARRRGRTFVFTNGCFDLLHPGHVRLLMFARRRGDILAVAVNSDASVRRIKGPGRPVNPLRLRLRTLAALPAVDYVTSFSGNTPLRLIGRLKPDVLVKGADWRPDEVVGRREVEAAGGRVIRFPVVKGFSTTRAVRAAGHRCKPE